MRARAAKVLTMLFIALLLPAALGACGAAPRPNRFEFTQLHMGVPTRIECYAPDEETARAAAAAAFARIAGLDTVMSDYRPDSELMRLCDRAGGPPVAVSADLFAVLRRAREISEATDGAFDITIGAAVALWRESRRTGELPDADRLAAARALIGYEKVELFEEARTVRLAATGMRLDLGGIGKGFAAGEGLKVMRARGLPRSLVALGGDIAAGDPPPGQRGWRIGVDLGGGEDPSGTILIANESISTSGDTEQFIEIDGVRYSHIIDPRTGLGATTRAAAAVIAKDGATADALASALCIVTDEEAAAIAGRFATTSIFRIHP